MLTTEEQREIEAECAAAEKKRAVATDALKIVQRHRGWISDEALKDVAAALDMSPCELDSLATLFSGIYRRPVGRHVILICDSVSCWIMGYHPIGVPTCGQTRDHIDASSRHHQETGTQSSQAALQFPQRLEKELHAVGQSLGRGGLEEIGIQHENREHLAASRGLSQGPVVGHPQVLAPEPHDAAHPASLAEIQMTGGSNNLDDPIRWPARPVRPCGCGCIP